MRGITKKMASVGINLREISDAIGTLSIRLAVYKNKSRDLIAKLRKIQPDLSEQYTGGKDTYNEYHELKMRGLHAFQCSLMRKVVESLPPGKMTIVDIGDSAGTHMLYLRELVRDRYCINSISVNLDPTAVEKARAKGQKALLCRAEDLTIEEPIDLFTSFEMVEHLHNPSIFFRRLATKAACSRMIITVPFLKKSRVGLHHLRSDSPSPVAAEDVHIFELSPADWTLLLLHSGWRVVHSDIYYQYPKGLPFISQVFAWYWKLVDYEGFWGAVLEKDTTLSDLYKDWEE